MDEQNRNKITRIKLNCSMTDIKNDRNGSKSNSTVNFTKLEVDFLLAQEVCRIATTNKDTPHVTPISYLYEDGKLIFATDYGTRKYRNIKRNNRVAIAVDIYDSSTINKAIIIEGNAKLIERGSEFKRLYNKFYRRFEWVRREPWREGEAPFVIVTPTHKLSWGIR
jgi:nitroimidazol reductase NimA-like FMN-containing flavoprotein (pyridoxamine 5'-phosphate oxidase superfamily)